MTYAEIAARLAELEAMPIDQRDCIGEWLDDRLGELRGMLAVVQPPIPCAAGPWIAIESGEQPPEGESVLTWDGESGHRLVPIRRQGSKNRKAALSNAALPSVLWRLPGRKVYMESAHKQVVVPQQPSSCFTLPPHEEADLSWYFGPGSAYFERSTFGDQLSRTEQFAHKSEPCSKCEGFGFTELSAAEIVKRAKRLVLLAESITDRLRTIDDAEKREHEKARMDREREKLTKETVCDVCEGSKVEAKRLDRPKHPYDAQPKKSSYEELKEAPDDAALCRYARVCRRLDSIPEKHVNVLRLYYGDIGSMLAAEREGRLLALYALTPPGKKLARKGLSKDDADALEGLGVRPDQSVVNQAEAQRRNPETNRGRMLLEAREQSRKLLSEAAHAWELTQ